jgi:hypothetical protein
MKLDEEELPEYVTPEQAERAGDLADKKGG